MEDAIGLYGSVISDSSLMLKTNQKVVIWEIKKIFLLFGQDC
jgi:hypothetical protein